MKGFSTVQPRRISDEIGDQIRARLANSELVPGDKLPPERILAEELGVSRNALREALRSLESKGIIRLSKGAKGGAFIAQGDVSSLTTQLTDLFQLQGVTVDELMEARLQFGDAIIRLACERMTAEDIALLRENYAEAKAAFDRGDVFSRMQLNLEFHNILARSTKNRVYIFVMEAIMAVMGQFVARHGERLNKEALEWRARLIPLIEARDGDGAAAEMRHYIEALATRYRLFEQGKAG